MSDPLGWTMAVAVGLVLGQIADRMVERLALARSFFWPIRERCRACQAPLPLEWAIPVLGFFLAGGKCRRCGARLRIRGIFLILLTTALVVGLYALYLGRRDPEGFYFPRSPLGYDEPRLRALWIYHSLLMTLLVAATFIDFDWMIIPDSVTVTGMILAIALGTFWYVELHPILLFQPQPRFTTGIIRADFFTETLGLDSVPSWLENARLAINEHWREHWNRWLGFLTGLAGLVIGGATVWVVRALTSWIFRTEAIGFGDVTLMAMVGAFVGWQTAIVAFFLAPISAVFFGIAAWITTGNRAIPYGPHLSIASAACVFFWRPLWAECVELFDHMGIVLFMAVAMLVILVLVASMIQGIKGIAQAALRART